MYDPFQLSIYSVSFLEPLYATPRETVAHFRNEDVLRRYLPVDRTAIREGCHLILCDPLGCSPGEAARLAGVRSSLGAAARRADQLAQRFGIRFLVARLTGVVHTH